MSHGNFKGIKHQCHILLENAGCMNLLQTTLCSTVNTAFAIFTHCVILPKCFRLLRQINFDILLTLIS